MKKSMKVYKVSFAELVKNDEYTNVESKIVLARDASDAIECAIQMLTKGQSKTYFVESVELREIID